MIVGNAGKYGVEHRGAFSCQQYVKFHESTQRDFYTLVSGIRPGIEVMVQ